MLRLDYWILFREIYILFVCVCDWIFLDTLFVFGLFVQLLVIEMVPSEGGCLRLQYA